MDILFGLFTIIVIVLIYFKVTSLIEDAAKSDVSKALNIKAVDYLLEDVSLEKAKANKQLLKDYYK